MTELLKLKEKYEGKEPPNVKTLGKYPIAYPGLTLFYGLSGSFKSYSSVIMAGSQEYDAVYYLDFEGNSVDLKEHCEKNNVFYLNFSLGSKTDFSVFLTEIAKLSSKYKILVILDSFSRVFQVPVNETEKIDEIFQMLKIEPTNNNYSLLIIDHAKKDVFGIDIRGGDNKKKFADMVLKVKEANHANLTCEIEVEKSRIMGTKPKDIFKVSVNSISLRDEFIFLLKEKDLWLKKKGEINKKLSKKQRIIYKDFIENLELIYEGEKDEFI